MLSIDAQGGDTDILIDVLENSNSRPDIIEFECQYYKTAAAPYYYSANDCSDAIEYLMNLQPFETSYKCYSVVNNSNGQREANTICKR